jgi:hypothetical protein
MFPMKLSLPTSLSLSLAVSLASSLSPLRAVEPVDYAAKIAPIFE